MDANFGYFYEDGTRFENDFRDSATFSLLPQYLCTLIEDFITDAQSNV